MNNTGFKIAYVQAWRPVRLARWHIDPSGVNNSFEFVGWVWRQKAFLVNNLNHGWIAFVEDQTPEKLSQCPCCGRPNTPISGGTSAA